MKKVAEKAVVTKRPRLEIERLALSRWYAQESDVAALRAFRDSPVGQRVFGVLYASIPGGFPIRGEPVTDIQAACELGRANGHLGCVQLLELMCEFPKPVSEHEEPTFGAEQILKDQ